MLRMILLALSMAGFATEIDKLSFMTCCWAGPYRGQWNEEVWMSPRGGTMMGLGRNRKGTDTTFTEFVSIDVIDGILGMTVQHKLGQSSLRFPLKTLTSSEVVFENPAHDTPRRIIYRARGRNGLFARIEGVRKGKEFSEDFPMKRVACK